MVLKAGDAQKVMVAITFTPSYAIAIDQEYARAESAIYSIYLE